MEDTLADLNPEQRQAVMATEGFIRVIAGAGSGKTRALSHRFAYLVNDIGILPGNILCVTFTNKAASEMRQRIHKLTGDNDTGYICTFHSLCVTILQEDSHVVHYPKSFLVLGNPDVDAMLEIIYAERGLTMRDMTFSQARDKIEIRKLFKEPKYYLDIIDMDLNTLRQKYLSAIDPEDIIFYGYLYQEKKCFALDYNDLLTFTLYIFEKDDAIRNKWQKRLEYIMIDEFQDIDKPQYDLMSILCDYHKNLFIVGDPDQTIYSWRGAKVQYLMDFPTVFAPAQTIMMMRNYRSTPEILNTANSLIAANKNRIRKALIPTLPSGLKVQYLHANAPAFEADWIAKKIAELHEAGRPYRDITILYRAHYISRHLEEAFMANNIPYIFYSGTQFFERMEIRDAISYLRLIAYKDDLSFLRVINRPRRNIGKTRLRFLEEYARAHECTMYQALVQNLDNPKFAETKAREFVDLVEAYSAAAANHAVSEVLSSILNTSGYEAVLRTEGNQERLDNLAELKQAIFDYETTCGEECTLDNYLTHLSLFTGSDGNMTSERVKMMTIHTAKGLEFPVVFLCELNEAVLPSKKTRTLAAMEEERRLSFVAMTRAQEELYLSDAHSWQMNGSPRYPSRFIFDIEKSLLEPVQPLNDDYFAEARRYINTQDARLNREESYSVLRAGTRVQHDIFGKGTVVDIDEERAAHIVQFDNQDTPRAIAFKAKLHQLN